MMQVVTKLGRSVLRQTVALNRLQSNTFVPNRLACLRTVFPTDKCLSQKFSGVRQVQHFHTTPCRRIHPIVLIILRPLSKVLAIFLGRRFRQWWQSLPQSQKLSFWQKLVDNRGKILVASAVLSLVPVAFYASHIQEAPITKRRRFILFTPEQFDEISGSIFDAQIEMLQSKIVKTNNSAYNLVTRVANRLLAGNQDLPQIYNKKWSITIVDDEEHNAFILPSGQIFVFTGMLKVCSNDDQLGVVLGHEMAHAVLGHTAELLSYTHIVDLVMLVVVAAVWAILPTDLIAAVAHWATTRVKDLLLELPYSRMLEAEADEVGLQLAAKCCFDVRESSAFWSKMETLRDMNSEIAIEWLSTHPNHETRVAQIESHLPKAIDMRQHFNCPPLPKADPRDNIKSFRDWAESLAKKQREMVAVPLNPPTHRS